MRTFPGIAPLTSTLKGTVYLGPTTSVPRTRESHFWRTMKGDSRFCGNDAAGELVMQEAFDPNTPSLRGGPPTASFPRKRESHYREGRTW